MFSHLDVALEAKKKRSAVKRKDAPLRLEAVFHDMPNKDALIAAVVGALYEDPRDVNDVYKVGARMFAGGVYQPQRG